MSATLGKHPMLVRPILPTVLALNFVLLSVGLYGFLSTKEGAQVPVHWGLSGAPDRFGGRYEAFLLIPAIGIILSLLLVFLPEFARGVTRSNLAKSALAWRVCTVATLGLLVSVQIGINAAAVRAGFPMNYLVMSAVSLMFIAIGAVISKTRPNPWMGIRTPWTLRNETAWTRTHRAASQCFVGIGLLSLVLTLTSPPAVAVAVLVLGLLSSSIYLVIYSRIVCLAEERRLQDKVESK